MRLAHAQDALGDARERLGVLKQRHLSPRAVTAEEAGALDVDVAETKVEQLRRRLEALGPVNPWPIASIAKPRSVWPSWRSNGRTSRTP